MRGTLLIALLAAGWLASEALANPKVIELQVPEPSKAPPPPPPPSAPRPGAPEGTMPDATTPAVPAEGGRAPVSAARREAREAKGEAPQALWGRYTVVQITRGGETEDFRIKMDREGRALKQDCITDQVVFDFGELAASAGQLPAVVSLAEQQLCSKGGFGTYANELSLEVPAAWQTDGTGVQLTLPPVSATGVLVRVRPPSDNDDLNTPSHWLGPMTKMERPRAEFKVLAEYGAKPRAAKAGEAERQRPAVLHLVGRDTVFHLEPEPDGGLFSVPPLAADPGARTPRR
jgi:hypothetical protein